MPSCYNSGIEICHRLAALGHKVSLVSDKNIGDRISNNSISFHHLTLEERYPPSPIGYKDAIGSLTNKHILNKSNVITDLRRSSITDRELNRLIENLKPSAFLIDIECHLAVLMTRQYNLPTAICSRLFDHRYHSDIPPLHSCLPLRKTHLGKAHINLQWLRLWATNAYIRSKSYWSRSRLQPINHRTSRMPDIKAVAKFHGVKLGKITTTFDWFRPFTYNAYPILSMNAEELDFQYTRKPGFHYVGPMIRTSNTTFTISSTDQSSYDSFIQRHQSRGKYLVYCATGTWLKTNYQFKKTIIDTAKANPELSFILSLGGQSETTNSIPDIDNLCVLSSAPQVECLKKADVCFIHGGIASINEAIFYQVPMILCSTGTNDQNGNVARMIHHDLAVYLDMNKLNPSTVREALYQQIMNKNLRNKLKRLNESFAKYSNQNSELKQFVDSLLY